ncbi:MAG: bifunctional ornithine acetyltransferase/N-acetylglutamate synthase, partial [Thermoplasmata archaeon]|nr:bifunctional ornithine acetyltransferase/N-acetylglutamate synthase [Thermoplasmata archaeon]
MKQIEGSITAPEGFLIAAGASGIKKDGDDLVIIYSEAPCRAAATFTTNRVVAAPVKVSREHISDGVAQAVVVSVGSANCCTGAGGLEDARTMASVAAEKLDINPRDVLVASTGRIGTRLPMERVREGIE